ncbi:hypothetical protein ABT324_12835 [Saccharopolyspora sp. NPDC000359]|uniref:hypothetical protein n=1 Tax=Saccharopolyspora sp. NPDC000359 TaxID=3154251 RepID=UPI003331EC58
MTSPQNPWQPNQQFAPQQQYPAQPQQFGYPQQHGYPQHAYPQQHVPLTPPGGLVFASWMGAVWAPISAVLHLVGFAISTMEILDYGSAPVLPILINGVLALGVAACAVFWVVFAGGLRKGGNSARVTLVVLDIAWMLYLLYAAVMFVLSLDGDFGLIIDYPVLLMSIADLLISLTATVLFLCLVFGKNANAYVKAMTGR